MTDLPSSIRTLLLNIFMQIYPNETHSNEIKNDYINFIHAMLKKYNIQQKQQTNVQVYFFDETSNTLIMDDNIYRENIKSGKNFLGKGSYGYVYSYKNINDNSDKIAIKMYTSLVGYEDEKNIYMKHIKNLPNNGNDIFAKIYGFHQISETRGIMVMRECEQLEKMRITSYELVITIMLQIVEKVKMLLENNLIFADLKIANIVKCKDQYMLIDIGSICNTTMRCISTYTAVESTGNIEYNSIIQNMNTTIYVLFFELLARLLYNVDNKKGKNDCTTSYIYNYDHVNECNELLNATTEYFKETNISSIVDDTVDYYRMMRDDTKKLTNIPTTIDGQIASMDSQIFVLSSALQNLQNLQKLQNNNIPVQQHGSSNELKYQKYVLKINKILNKSS